MWCRYQATSEIQVRPHLGMLGGARFGRLGTCGLSPLLLKGPRGPGRVGGGGAPRPAGLWPADILRGAVGLGGGDLRGQKGHQWGWDLNECRQHMIELKKQLYCHTFNGSHDEPWVVYFTFRVSVSFKTKQNKTKQEFSYILAKGSFYLYVNFIAWNNMKCYIP